jgi:hypothetical protein
MSLREQKVVYNAVGLGRLWSAINQLRVMAGEAPLPVTEPEDHSVVRHGVWSLREFALRVRQAHESVGGPFVQPPVLTIRTTGSLVGIPAAAVRSLRKVFLDEARRVP